MKYVILPSDDGTHIVLAISGEFTADEILRASVEAHRYAQEREVFRLLCDVRQGRNRDSVRGNYHFARAGLPAALQPDPRMRVAILVSPDDPSHDFPRVAIETTGHNVAFFTNYDDAIAYLG